MLVNVQGMKDIVAGDDNQAVLLHRELCDLADELNDILSDHYKVQLVHYDTQDCLEILPVEKEK
jgi:hypothetical protein